MDLELYSCLVRSDDTYNLKRFVTAQDGGVYERAIAELRRGVARSHWSWFIFPQLSGLGRSAMARLYAISCLDEARAYIDHPVLGPRLVESAWVVEASPASDAVRILGPVDAMKLHSSMTLFLRAKPEEPVFKRVLDKYFAGELDAATEAVLARAG